MKINDKKIHDNILRESKGVAFYKFFLVILVAIMIPVIALTTVISKVSQSHLIKQVNLSREELLSQKQKIVEQKLMHLDAIVNQLVNDENVWKLITGSGHLVNPELYMRNALHQFEKQVSAYDMVDSVYLYDTGEYYILSDAKYMADQFPDFALFSTSFNGFATFTVPRTVEGKKIFSYVRKFSSFENVPVIIVVNLDYNHFWKSLFEYSEGLHYIIFDSNNDIIFQDNQDGLQFDYKMLQEIRLKEENHFELKNDDKNSYFWKRSQGGLGWTFVLTQPSKDLFKASYILKRISLFALIIVLVVSLLLAFVFSQYLYKPIVHIKKKINGIIQSEDLKSNNEYDLIEQVLTGLCTDNKELTNNYEYVYPYFEEHSIRDLLEGDFKVTHFNKVLELFNINFDFQNFYLMIIECENRELDCALKQKIEAYLGNDEIKNIMSQISRNKALVVLNTPWKEDEFYEYINGLHHSFNNNNIELTISLSNVFYNINDLQLFYEHVQKQLEYKFFVGANRVIMDMNLESITKNTLYDQALEKQLLTQIKNQNQKEANEYLELIKESLKENISEIEYTKYIYFQICLNIIKQSNNFGFNLSDIQLTNRDVFQKIHEALTIDELQEFLKILVDKSINLFANLKLMQNSKVVNKVKQYIKKYYYKDLSLENISEHVYLSQGYLSTLFKEETGITVFDYLTNIRMDQAKEILLTSDLKVQEIALKLGYNSSQSFIRYFKKYYNITPNQYRKFNEQN